MKQTWTQNTASPLVYNNMGWLGDGSHRGLGCQAWTAVGLPPRYPLSAHISILSVDISLRVTSTEMYGSIRKQRDNLFIYCRSANSVQFCVLYVPSVLWYCWLGLLTCKNGLPYNLYCVGGDVKHCSIQSNVSCKSNKSKLWRLGSSVVSSEKHSVGYIRICWK